MCDWHNGYGEADRPKDYSLGTGLCRSCAKMEGILVHHVVGCRFIEAPKSLNGTGNDTNPRDEPQHSEPDVEQSIEKRATVSPAPSLLGDESMDRVIKAKFCESLVHDHIEAEKRRSAFHAGDPGRT